jgi:hypothetical protein
VGRSGSLARPSFRPRHGARFIRARDQTAAVLTLIVGIIFGRYVLRTAALAQLPAERYRHARMPLAIAAAQIRPRPLR